MAQTFSDGINADKPEPTLPERAKAMAAKVAENVKGWWEDLHIGEGHAPAMGRLGAHELTNALAAFPESNIRPMEEPGTVGNPTPQLVSQEMGYDDMLKEAAGRSQESDNDRGMSR